MMNQAPPPLPPGDTLLAAKSRVTTARNNFEKAKEEAICNLGVDFVDWRLLESSPDQFARARVPLVLRTATAACELIAAENGRKLADQAVVAVQEASTPATLADVKDLVGAFQTGFDQLGTRMDEICDRVEEIAEQTAGLRKSIQQDLVTTGRTIHQHVVKELQQQKVGLGAYSPAEMKEQGADSRLLNYIGHTAQQLKEAGYSPRQVMEGGFLATEVGAAFGLKGQALQDSVGYCATELTAFRHTKRWDNRNRNPGYCVADPNEFHPWYPCCRCRNKSSRYCK
jgi:hypothetical protein